MKIKMQSRVQPKTSAKEDKEIEPYIGVAHSLMCAYVVTGILLLILAAFLYQMDIGQEKVAIGIILIYIIGNFCGGYKAGKYMCERKYLWGLLVGLLYVVLLFLITLVVYRTMNHNNVLSTIVLCMASGMIGGMIS